MEVYVYVYTIVCTLIHLFHSHSAVPIRVSQSNGESGYETVHHAGSITSFDLPPKAENAVYQALADPSQPEAGYEKLNSSTRDRLPAVYNKLHRLTSPVHEYSIPRGVTSPSHYGKLPVEAQYTVSACMNCELVTGMWLGVDQKLAALYRWQHCSSTGI